MTIDLSVLDTIYHFMSLTYQGNWQYRAGSTPFMQKALEEGKKESILAHQWSCMALWYQLRHVCLELNKVVNSTELYERILNHDVSEVQCGDISLVIQLEGKHQDKHVQEREQLQHIIKGLSESIQQEMLSSFDQFEEDISHIMNIEILVAKFIESLQDDHFCLKFGDELPKYSELIQAVLEHRFFPRTYRLLEVLTQRGDDKAKNEVIAVAHHHVEQIRKAGIHISLPQNFNTIF